MDFVAHQLSKTIPAQLHQFKNITITVVHLLSSTILCKWFKNVTFIIVYEVKRCFIKISPHMSTPRATLGGQAGYLQPHIHNKALPKQTYTLV